MGELNSEYHPSQRNMNMMIVRAFGKTRIETWWKKNGTFLRKNVSFSTRDFQPKSQSSLVFPGQHLPEIEQPCRTRSGKHDTAVDRYGVAFDEPPISRYQYPCDLPL